MAGDWIKYDVTLPEKPEVWQIGALTGLANDAVIGKLLRIWAWFDSHTEDGTCNALTVTQLDGLVTHEGFSEAMAEVGWLVSHKSKRVITVPGFDMHNGKTAKARALTNARVKRFRNGDGVSKALPEKRREEKRKEEEKKTPRPALPPAERRDGGARLEAAPPTPSAGEAPTRTPAQRTAGLTHLSAMLRPVHPPSEIPDEVRTQLATKAPIPIPTEDNDHAEAQAAG